MLSLRTVDKAYRAFDHLRSELILAFVTDAVLDRFNDLAFGTIREYRPDVAKLSKLLNAVGGSRP